VNYSHVQLIAQNSFPKLPVSVVKAENWALRFVCLTALGQQQEYVALSGAMITNGEFDRIWSLCLLMHQFSIFLEGQRKNTKYFIKRILSSWM
jgi:hypothetical protein